MTDEILSLQDKVKCLEKENQYLKSLLDRAGISYSTEKLRQCETFKENTKYSLNRARGCSIFYHASDEMKNRDLFDPDQGKRIIPREITDHDANLFFGMLWGRTDVYAKRTLRKSTGEINYYTQCYNFYKTGCPVANIARNSDIVKGLPDLIALEINFDANKRAVCVFYDCTAFEFGVNCL